MLRRTLVSTLAVALMLPLTGCLITSRNHEDLTGTEVNDATFNRIEPGTTTRQWILGTLGQPTTQTTLEDGSELWKWSFARTRSSSGSLLFVFGGSSSTVSSGSAYVQMKDGVVTKAWRTE